VVGVLGSRLGAGAAADMGYGWRELDAHAIGCMEAVFAAGMVPLGIPSLPEMAGGRWCDLVDGLVVSPAWRCQATGGRDDDGVADLELSLVREALGRRLPVLAICWAVRALDPALASPEGAEVTAAGEGLPSPAPACELEVGDPELRDLLGPKPVVVAPHPRLHPPLPPAWRAGARGVDGSVEAVIGLTCPALWVGWHPELLPPGDPAREGPFRWLRRRIPGP